MSARSSQRKGKVGEIELRDILRGYGYGVERGGSLTYGTVPDLTGLPGVHIEGKRVEQLNLHKAMEQSKRDAEKFGDGLPAVFHRKNHTGWLVTMPLSEWIKLYSGNNDAKGEFS